ncbi:peptide deformylase [Thalassobaculum sp. OXR-137]|uniref:peptide deformylase n=1 Tax=Thalassobaculum sp. OXR-137 TaxID=3100173 RepID=UPI002AC9D6BE|nr:peptide deformylase [Thalassobaculum sp. OXR-137]WPZ35110.1 peptide deformylase [Thalassobaculum sp. OXR-137]
MAKRPIIWAPDPVLKTKCTPVPAVDDEIRTLMDDMLDTMYAAPGIGLAAPQIGVTKRVIVVDVSEKDEPRAPICLANPEIVWKSDETAPHEEGCLSLPDLYADVERPVAVKVRYLDRDGAGQELEADGLLAICLQHEIDHIDGVLFVDHLSALKRNMFLKKMVKAKKARAREDAA